jgi:hypothetical protein
MGVSALGSIMSTRITHYVKDGLADLGPKGAALGHGGTGGGAIPDLDKLPAPLRTIMESSYGHGIADVFLIAAPIALLALIAMVFIKEVPLRTSGGLDQAKEAEAAASGAPAGLTATQVAGVDTEKVPSLVGAGEPAADTQTQRLAAVASAPAGNVPAQPGTGGTPVHGFVRGAESAPVPRAAITLISLGGRQLGRAVAQGDGSYTVDAPGAGSYVLIASADGYQPQASTVVVGENGEYGGSGVAYDILLSGTSGLSGVVKAAETKAPVVGAMVIVTDVRGDVLATGLSGQDGEFTFAELVPGAVTVAVNAAGHRPLALPVEVGGTGVTRVDVELNSGSQVQGTVRAAGGRSLDDARVTLVDAAGNVVATSTTGDDGAYAFTDLDGGEYTVIATGYPPVATHLTVNGSGVDGHDIELAHPGE